MSDIRKNTAAEATATASASAKPKPKANGQHKPAPPEKQLRPLQAYPGTVGEFGANPDGVYDRFVLEAANTPSRTVKFPPHFGEALRALAQPGQTVTVLGFVHLTPKGDEHLHLAQLTADGTTIRPQAPGPDDAVTVSGPIAELRHTPKGHLHGLRLTGAEAELRLPPHLGQQLAERLAVGTQLTASGRRRALRPGEVAAQPAPVQVELLTLGNESFLLH